MKKMFAVSLLAACTVFSAQAQSEASAALSLVPVASVVGAASVAGAAAGAVVALSGGGRAHRVVAVVPSAAGTVYRLARASDGARASVRLAGAAAQGSAIAVGTVVTVGVIGSGVVLSAAGEMIAFIPNTIGRALLHNERLM